MPRAPDADGGLAGLGVLVTRPRHQAAALCATIEAEGGRPWPFPVLEILPPRDPAAADAVLRRLGSFDIAIFISVNAVDYGLERIGCLGPLPGGLRLAAVGQGSARALAERTGRPVIAPAERFDSEGLLACPELADVSGQRVLIVRGEGGRELLAGGLRGRGATVEYAEVYRRARPEADVAGLLAGWRPGAVDAVVASSGEGLRNLADLLGPEGRDRLISTPLVVVSPRMVEIALALGFRAPVRVAREASDEAIVEALRTLRAAPTPAGPQS